MSRVIQSVDLRARRYNYVPIWDLFEMTRGHFHAVISAELCLHLGYNLRNYGPGNDSLKSYLRHFPDVESKKEFLGYYVARFFELIAGEYSCDCEYDAEQPVPCEHDWMLFEAHRPEVQQQTATIRRPTYTRRSIFFDKPSYFLLSLKEQLNNSA